MADKLIFPVGFDLNKGVADAIKDWEQIVSKKLENGIAKYSVKVKLSISDSALKGLQDRFDKIKINPLTAEAKASIREMATELRGLAKALEAVQKVQNLRMSADTNAVRAARIAAVQQASDDKHEESLIKQRKLTAQAEAAEIRRTKAASGTTRAYKDQYSYLERLVQRMAVYTSLGAIVGFASKVREVTAEFELQRISLGAIIQDQARANQLFSEIKQFALKSPVKILDLTRYTKQLAAYKIGTDELFDTTKRLADISVGLGVSMDRIILMYGQIRATGYLRASEVRQATEAGIPLVESLADKLTQVNGKLVTSADVMEMISKRAISFEMVKEVFDDMTSAGGIFYNMQEKQGNTLYGMWQKLGDAAAMMYDEIGNTEFVNTAMKDTINLLRTLMLHWKQTGTVLAAVASYLIMYIVQSKNAALATKVMSTSNIAHVASLRAKLGALQLEQAGLSASSLRQRLYTAATISATKAQIAAATSTNIFSRALYSLKAALLANPFTALIIALTTVVSLVMESENEIDKLNSKLQDIDRDYKIERDKSVDRFKELAQAATENADGTRAQKEALDELDRTYSKILGHESLEVDYLRSLKGEYGELIDLIDVYNAKRKGEEKETAIKSTYSQVLEDEKNVLRRQLNAYGMSSEKIAEFFTRLNENVDKFNDYIKATDETFKEFAKDIDKSLGNSALSLINVFDTSQFIDAWAQGVSEVDDMFREHGNESAYGYAKALMSQTKALEENEQATRAEVDALAEYLNKIDDVAKKIQEVDFVRAFNMARDVPSLNSLPFIPLHFEFDPALAETEFDKATQITNEKIHILWQQINEIAKQEGIKGIEQFYKEAESTAKGNKSFSIIDFDALKKQFSGPKALAAIKAAQDLYEGLVPTDRTARSIMVRLQMLAGAAGVNMQKMTGYFMQAGENIEDYAKRIKESIDGLNTKLKEMAYVNQMVSKYFGGFGLKYSDKEIKETKDEVNVLKSLFSSLDDFAPGGKKTKSGGGASKSDPRLQNAQEAVSILEKLYTRYKELLKTMSRENALSYINKNYKESLDYLEKYGVVFDGTVKGQIEGLKKMRAVIEGLPKSTKAVAEVDLKIGDVSLANFTDTLKKRLDKIAAEVSKSKEAKDFFTKIFEQTSDYDLAMSLTVSVYGEGGEEMQQKIAEQLQSVLQGGSDAEGNVWGIQIPAKDIVDPKTFEVNYGILRDTIKKMGDKIPEEQKKMLDDILKNGEKFMSTQAAQWAKDLQKAKDYVDKYVDTYQTIAKRQEEIRKQRDKDLAAIDYQVKIGKISAEEGKAQKANVAEIAEEMLEGYNDKWAKEQQKLQYEAFKDTPLYTSMFENLENASVGALTAMKEKLQDLKSEWGALDPSQIKELQSRLNEIDEQLAEKDPFKTIAEGWSKMNELANKESETYGIYGSRANLDDMIAAQSEEIDRLQKELDDALERKRDAVPGSDDYTTASMDVALISVQLKKAQAEQDQLVDDANTWSQALKKVKAGVKAVTAVGRKLAEAAEAATDFAEAVGLSEDVVELFKDVNEVVNKTFDLIDALTPAIDLMSKTTTEGIKGVQRASIILAVITTALQVATALFNLFSNAKVRRAEKEIERQKRIIEDLEYSYSRLEKQIEKTFGGEYISNYNARLIELQAKALAYQKQAEAERSKGKKADKDALKDYEDSYRDTMDEIKDMQSEISETMLGTDLASAARDFASAWIDARKEFGSTTDAIKEKFQDMMQNMVVEGVLAAVMQRALQPVFNMIDGMSDSDFYNPNYWSNIQSLMDKATSDMNTGANNVMNMLESAGIALKSTEDGLTGISRDIATASEESINGLATGINTQNFYISQIYASVQGIYTLMNGKPGTAVSDTTLIGSQHLAQLPNIAQNTADTVARLDAMIMMLGKVIRPKNSVPQWVVNTNIN